MQLSVNSVQRYAKMRAHTATHLLHAQLAAIFPQTKQAGSLVDEDYLRFDFYADTALTDQQITDIENHVNTHIAQALPVTIEEMSYNQAIEAGAKAFFEDKYGDTVRVVMIGLSSGGKAEESHTQDSSLHSEGLVSIELCGGTHTANTAHIGAFVIISQEAVASGVKRITAVTGPKVAEESSKKNRELKDISILLGVQEKQIGDKIKSIQEENQKLESQKNTLEQSIAKNAIAQITTQKDNYIIIDTSKYTSLSSIPFKSLVQIAKDIGNNYILAESTGSFAIIGGQAKAFAQSHNLKGGGSDTFFQGKDPSILDLLS